MSKEDNGGPAFPCPQDCINQNTPSLGMTLRDYFAAKAMPIVIQLWADSCEAFDLIEVQDCIAYEAYAMADAMMEARTK